MHSRLTNQKKQDTISVRLYDLCISLFMDILRMIFTLLTPINMRACADPVSHNASKCVGLEFFVLRYSMLRD